MKRLLNLFAVAGFVFFAAVAADAQVVDAVKDAASKTKDVAEDAKDVTVKGAKKTTVVVTDGVETAADKTADAAVLGAKATASGTKKAASETKTFGSHTVSVSENVAEKAVEGGKYFTVTTWDGTKWVSKKVWYATKKTGSAIEDGVN